MLSLCPPFLGIWRLFQEWRGVRVMCGAAQGFGNVGFKKHFSKPQGDVIADLTVLKGQRMERD